MRSEHILRITVLNLLYWLCAINQAEASCKNTGTCPVTYTQGELLERLSNITYRVTQEDFTERPWTGALLHKNETGNFHCAVCNNPLYTSDTKYDSGTGWPSFYDVISKAVVLTTDTSFGWSRQEVSCARCGAHIGHVFDDGPQPTGKRYCMNSAAMQFQPHAKAPLSPVGKRQNV